MSLLTRVPILPFPSCFPASTNQTEAACSSFSTAINSASSSQPHQILGNLPLGLGKRHKKNPTTVGLTKTYELQSRGKRHAKDKEHNVQGLWLSPPKAMQLSVYSSFEDKESKLRAVSSVEPFCDCVKLTNRKMQNPERISAKLSITWKEGLAIRCTTKNLHHPE